MLGFCCMFNLFVVACLIFTDKENKQHIIDNGGISLVINCLSRYYGMQCCMVLLSSSLHLRYQVYMLVHFDIII